MIFQDLLFQLLVFAIVIALIGIRVFASLRKDDRLSKKATEENSFLVKNGAKLVVNLEDVEYLKNSWTDIVMLKRHANWHDEVSVERQIIKVKIPFKYNGQQYFHTQQIEKGLKTIQMHFALKKTTTLYVNRDNIADRYLDLRFMD